MHFENINQAKKELVEAILIQHKALLEDDDKTQENSINRAFKIDEYITQNFDLKEMKDLLMYNDPGVKSWIANMLLPIYEDISLEILNNIYKQNIPFISMSARAMFCKWKNEPISFD
ncbi:hypothetical protein HN014_16580 [Aquimarina sp. TRL1]|uniref:hypothetical protein n=1 Tax=Aquimarina sp. (strain TRL1) TaxID=2736252 RepID=UPI001589E864|nr:hypothetical protein [Aquimarina sp. TRL1]QKX06460.1 hypothetical protein HN014_16580 [Aquimarina sp. TRL1]